MKKATVALLFLLALSFLSVLPIPKVYAPFTYGNWSWDGTNKILTIDENSTNNEGDSWDNAYNFTDIVVSGVVPSSFFNVSDSGTQHEYDFRIIINYGCYFWDTNKQITFTETSLSANWQIYIYIKSTAYARFGVLEDATERTTSQGVDFIFLANYTLVSGIYKEGSGELDFYSSSISSPNKAIWGVRTSSSGDTYVFNSLFKQNANVRILDADSEIFNVIVQKISETALTNFQPQYANRIFVSDSNDAIGSSSSYTINIKNLYARNLVRLAYMNNWVVDGYLIDVDSDIWTIFWAGTSTGELYRQYTFRINVTDTNGVPIENANVTVKHYGQTETQDFSILTGSNGSFATQTLTMGFYNQTGGDTIYDYNPYEITITHASYDTLSYNITIDEETSLTLALFDSPELVTAIDYRFVGMMFMFVLGMIFMFSGFENRKSSNPSTALNVVAYHLFASIVFFLLSMQFLMAYSSATTFVLPMWMWFFGLGFINFTYFMVLIWRVFAVVWQKHQGTFLEED